MKKILEPIDIVIRTLDQIDSSLGYCMCGDSMEHHEPAYHAGHVPIDAGDYHVGALINAIYEFLPELDAIIKAAVEVVNNEDEPRFLPSSIIKLRKALKEIDLEEFETKLD